MGPVNQTQTFSKTSNGIGNIAYTRARTLSQDIEVDQLAEITKHLRGLSNRMSETELKKRRESLFIMEEMMRVSTNDPENSKTKFSDDDSTCSSTQVDSAEEKGSKEGPIVL